MSSLLVLISSFVSPPLSSSISSLFTLLSPFLPPTLHVFLLLSPPPLYLLLLLISSPSSPFSPILSPSKILTLQIMVRCWWWSRQQWGAAPYLWSSPSSCSSQEGEFHVWLGLCLLSWSVLLLSVVLGVWSMSPWVSASSSGLFYVSPWFWGSDLCLFRSLLPLVV